MINGDFRDVLTMSTVSGPRILVLAASPGLLKNATHLLPKSGCPVEQVFDEAQVLENVLGEAAEHHLLLVDNHMNSSCCLPQLVERLRQSGYKGCITICTHHLTPGLCMAYTDIPVDRCVEPPPAACATLLDTVEWLCGPGAPSGPGLSIFAV